MSDTPRTNNALQEWEMMELEFGHKFIELRGFARQLERELNESRKILRDLMVFVLDEYVPEFTSKQKRLAIEAAKKEAAK